MRTLYLKKAYFKFSSKNYPLITPYILFLVIEPGGLGPLLPELPISAGESRTFHQAVAASSMHDDMSIPRSG
jgi:hypothetical protein